MALSRTEVGVSSGEKGKVKGEDSEERIKDFSVISENFRDAQRDMSCHAY